MLFRFVACFARGRIEDSSFNRFALNGIPELPATLFFGITRKIPLLKKKNLILICRSPLWIFFKKKKSFLFLVMVISVSFLWKKIIPIFDDNSKNKNRRIFLLFFPCYSAHSAPLITTFWSHHFWRGGGGLHVRKWDIAQFYISRNL